MFLLGDNVGLSLTASIDVSADTDGGEVYIGGGYQGSDESLQNATYTFVSEGASIAAESVGGTAIVFVSFGADGMLRICHKAMLTPY